MHRILCLLVVLLSSKCESAMHFFAFGGMPLAFCGETSLKNHQSKAEIGFLDLDLQASQRDSFKVQFSLYESLGLKHIREKRQF